MQDGACIYGVERYFRSRCDVFSATAIKLRLSELGITLDAHHKRSEWFTTGDATYRSVSSGHSFKVAAETISPSLVRVSDGA